MLLVHCLPAYAEYLGDVLPGPPLAPGIGDLCSLQGLGQAPQRRGGLQPHSRVRAAGCRCQVSCCAHASSLIDVVILSIIHDEQFPDPRTVLISNGPEATHASRVFRTGMRDEPVLRG